MPFEKIKREFVRFMEDVRATDPYPRNFIGCLISLIIDPGPVSQERIMELTGYSQATVSMTLQKLKLLMPIRTVRSRGDRRHYYEYDGPPEKFVVDLWQKRLEAQAISYQQIENMLDRVKGKSSGNKSIKRFQDYLEYLLLNLKIVSDLRISGVKEFEDMLNTKSIGDLKDQGVSSSEEDDIIEFLNNHRNESLESAMKVTNADGESNDLMRDYFSEIKTGFNPLFSQDAANQMIVVHSVFLEGCTTQEQLEEVTLLPRSTISEVLTKAVKRGLIRASRKDSSRTKLYHPAISFTDLMLGNFAQVELHISQVMPQIVEYRKRVLRIPNSINQKKPFLKTLKSLEEAYAFTQHYSRLMKMKMVTTLKDEIASGHTFI